MTSPSHGSLTTGPVGRTLMKFSLPTLGSNVLQSANASINTIWVGHFLGEKELAATASANLIMFLLLGVVFGFSIAASIIVGQQIGARRIEDAKRAVGSSTTFILLASVTVTVIGIVFTPTLLDWMQTPAGVKPLASAYMRVLFVGLPAMFFYQNVMNILRAAGDAKTPFNFMLCSVGFDILLNPPLIFGFGPIPRLGIAGSALAAVLAQTGTLVALLVTIYRRKFFLCIHAHELGYLRMSRQIIKVLVVRGLPMGLNMLVVSSSLLFTLALVNPYGAEVVAAMGAAFQIWTYIQMPAYAVGASVSAMAAQNIGAARWDRLPSITAAAIRINFWLTGIPVLALYIFDRAVMSLFLPANSPSIDIATHMNAISLWGFILFSLAFVWQSIPRAAGAVLVPMVVLIVAFWGIRLPFAIIASKHFGADGIWWSAPVGSVANCIMAWYYYKYGNWRSIKLFDRERAQSHVPVPSTPEPWQPTARACQVFRLAKVRRNLRRGSNRS